MKKTFISLYLKLKLMILVKILIRKIMHKKISIKFQSYMIFSNFLKKRMTQSIKNMNLAFFNNYCKKMS
jgi:hypothetical protein